MYSTPSCYLKALNEEGLDWSTKSDDFFPYASDAHAYWTGYFTSRPTSKRFIRESSGYLQFAKQLTARAFANKLDFVRHLNLNGKF
jgi:lysosomal alpha-mannosidase